MFDQDSFSGFNLTNLNLGGVKAATSAAVLTPGRYICEIRSCKLEDTKAKDGSKSLAVLLSDKGGKGVITAFLNVHNKKSAEATRIGLEQLKGLAVSAGVPDPDAPFATGMKALDGLTVGVVVGTDTYNGTTKSKVNGFCKPEAITNAAPAVTTAATAGSIGSDDIPF